MKHILDYNILKEWGFTWAERRYFPSSKKLVISYFLDESKIRTDMFSRQSFGLFLLPHPNISEYWILSPLERDEEPLFKGQIKNDTALKHILESTLIFKPE